MMPPPVTPRKTGKQRDRLLLSLNNKFSFDLPVGGAVTARTSTVSQECVRRIYFLCSHNDDAGLARVEKELEQRAGQLRTEWVYKPRQEKGTVPVVKGGRPAEGGFLRSRPEAGVRARNDEERRLLLDTLKNLLDEEVYLTKNKLDMSNTEAAGANAGMVAEAITKQSVPDATTDYTHAAASEQEQQQQQHQQQSPSKRKPNGIQEALPRKDKQQRIDKYYAASPRKNSTSKNCSEDPFQSPQQKVKKQQPGVNDYMRVSKVDGPSSRLFSPNSKSTTEKSVAETSFATTTTSTSDTSAVFSSSGDAATVASSFETEHDDKDSQDSLFRSDQFRHLLAISGQDLAQDPTEVKVKEIVEELETNGPFAKRRTCRSTLPFRYLYEAQRIANASGIALADMMSHDRLPCESYDGFWRHVRDQCRNLKGQECLLAKSKSGPWDMAVDHFQDTRAETDDLVTLGGRLKWCDKTEDGFFDFQLNPLRFERGNRLCRRFGSDRFLEVVFPVLEIKGLPSHLNRYSSKPALLLEGITHWLATSEHHIAGRVWRGFYLEDVKKDGPRECKVHLFAVDGDDFVKQSYPPPTPPNGQSSDKRTYFSVEALVDWHIPLAENSGQSDCKLFQRMALGLSRTLPTVSILPEETIFLEDRKPVMNDGCARMSRSLAVRVAEHLSIGSTPSCFQARIAGAKGVWMVARDDDELKDKVGGRDCWIEISESQLKIHPHPCYKQVPLDSQQLNFEVVSWCRPLRPANLNTQLLMVLQHGGVLREHLKTLLEQEISRFYEEFKTIMTCNNSAVCRQWLQSRAYDESHKRKTRRVDGFPESRMEEAILLVESGFLPLQLPCLTGLFNWFLRDHLEQFGKLKIQISRSTYAYCIADPYGILKEDEVHFAFSRSWEEHGYHGAELDDIDVLVARLPAHKPSDVQKRRAVYKKELRHFRDVIVFPTVGDTPLASLLSGGDYDGDQPWVCWDANVVDAFRNTPYQESDSFKAEHVGLVNHSVDLNAYCLPGQGRPGSLDNFLAKMFSVNAVPSKLGLCTVQHEKLCYHENRIDSKGARKLADLLGHLVDARKAGHEFPPENFRNLQTELGLGRLAKPAYKESQETGHNPANIIDYLKFSVIRTQSERVIGDFASLRKNEGEHGRDSDLIAEWKRVWDEAVAEREESTVLLDALHQVEQSVREAYQRWLPVARSKRLPFHEVIDRAAEMLEDIRPPALSSSDRGKIAQLQHEHAHPWFYTWNNSKDSWATFRASCVYYHCTPCSKFPWYAAGTTLCAMKARSSGHARTTIWPVYTTFKVDRKAAKRQREETLRNSESDDDEVARHVDAEEGDETEVQTEDDAGDENDDWVSLA